jgi:exodeoxyribonuclease VII small subunit
MEKENLKFEDELSKLEKIVNELETGQTDLDEAISKYTEAMKLAKECSDKLKNAEENVNKILMENGKEEDFNVQE